MSIKAFLYGRKTDGLKYTLNDLLSMKEALISCGAKSDDITICESYKKGELIEKYDDFLSLLDKVDIAIVYCTGHGVSKNGKLNFKINDGKDENKNYISFNSFDDGLKASNAKKKLLY